MINFVAMCARCKRVAFCNINLTNEQVTHVQNGGTVNVIHPENNSDDDNVIHAAKVADVSTTRLLSFSTTEHVETGRKIPVLVGCEGGEDCQSIPSHFKVPLSTKLAG